MPQGFEHVAGWVKRRHLELLGRGCPSEVRLGKAREEAKSHLCAQNWILFIRRRDELNPSSIFPACKHQNVNTSLNDSDIFQKLSQTRDLKLIREAAK